MRISALRMAACLAMVLAASCGEGQEEALSLKVGYIPIAECLPLYVAEENGYFAREGLEVELQPLAGGAVILSSLVSGALDVGFSNVVSLVLQRSEGQDFFAVYGATYETADHQNHALFARSGFQHTAAASWKGARIAINTRQNIEELMVLRFLEDLGVSPDDVEFQPVAFPQMLPALESGSVDVVAAVEPFVTLARAGASSSDVQYLTNQYLALSPQTLVATYVSSQGALDRSAPALEAFERAMTSATEFIHANEPQARAILGKYTQIPADLLPTIGLSDFRDVMDPEDLDAIIGQMKTRAFLTPTADITGDKLVGAGR